ncbi:MAG: carboxylating nicotinate-nucleotide diphosphorylase [Gammaproteobacteria bacterium]|nr:carboxylating nicotinate-nucleotide diphosphorylase [Gammaproteobacteria bacterium]
MLDVARVLDDVTRALKEDIGSGDITVDLISEETLTHAVILSREPMVMCGIPWVNQVFLAVDPNIKIEWQVAEGDYLTKPMTLAKLTGPVRSILTAERAALNFLQTLSGVATETRRYVVCLQGTKAQVLDTRKTLPGLRVAQKYAVVCGGGVNHRLGLYDAILIKENHIKACGSIKKAVHTARELGKGSWIEVEVESLDEFKEALKALPDRILLDNFDNEMLTKAVALNSAQKIILEASGGISLLNIASVAKTGVDYISVGAMTKSVRAIDLSLLLEEVA